MSRTEDSIPSSLNNHVTVFSTLLVYTHHYKYFPTLANAAQNCICDTLLNDVNGNLLEGSNPLKESV